MNKIFRSTKLVLSAAFFIVFIGSVDTTYAQGNFDQFVSVPNDLPALTVAPENSVEAGNEDNKEGGAKNQLRRSKNLVHLTPPF